MSKVSAKFGINSIWDMPKEAISTPIIASKVPNQTFVVIMLLSAYI